MASPAPWQLFHPANKGTPHPHVYITEPSQAFFMDLQAMTTKVTHSLKNITNHSSSEAASHPSRLESLVERYVLL